MDGVLPVAEVVGAAAAGPALRWARVSAGPR